MFLESYGNVTSQMYYLSVFDVTKQFLFTIFDNNEMKMKIDELSNLRPIMLLSTLRKILAIIMTSRIKDRIVKEIPPTQAAYRSGRSTTEHVFALKLAVERTLTPKDETLYLILYLILNNTLILYLNTLSNTSRSKQNNK